VVIIGAGFGGLWAAKALAHEPVDVVIIDRRNHHVFQPLLYQVATAALSPGDIASPTRWILRRQKNVTVWLAEATAVDVDRHVVKLTDGEIAYDHLIVSAGVSHAYFGHDEWQPQAPGLKTLEDALEIRRRILLAFEQAERESDPLFSAASYICGGGEACWRRIGWFSGEISRHALAHDFRSIHPESARHPRGGARRLPTYRSSCRTARGHSSGWRDGVDGQSVTGRARACARRRG
jgi:NADH dehydrogenase